MMSPAAFGGIRRSYHGISVQQGSTSCTPKAIIGMFFQDGLTGSAWGDWSLYTASPLRAGRESRIARNFFGGDSTSYASFDPAKELGVQDPIGFWDPLGLSADKDEATFKRRRAVEIKHGRIVWI